MNKPANPVPWHITDAAVYDQSGFSITGKIMRSDAEYIVQACNAFPALVEALEAMVEVWGLAGYPHILKLEQARAALALARGGEKGETK